MLAKSGLIVCPCPVPVSLTRSRPCSITPTLIHFRISCSTLASLIRFSTSSNELLSHYRVEIGGNINFQDPSRGSGACHSPHFVQRLMGSPSGSKPVGALEKILLINGIQHLRHRRLQDLILQRGNRNRSLLPVLLRYIDPAQRLGLVLPIPEPLIQLSDISGGVLFILFVRNPIYPRAGLLPETSECRIHRFGRD